MPSLLSRLDKVPIVSKLTHHIDSECTFNLYKLKLTEIKNKYYALCNILNIESLRNKYHYEK